VTGAEFHHGSLWYDPANGTLQPGDLKGRRIGVRAYTQTTGMWVRGVLEHQYGVKSEEVTWITTEGAHVAQYVNPSNVEIVSGDTDLAGLVRSGDLSAVIMGSKQSGGLGLQRVIPDTDKAAGQWYEENRAVPINHMVVVTNDLLEKNPAVVQDVYNLLTQGCDIAPDTRVPPGICYGRDKVMNAVNLAIQYSLEQKLISREFTMDEIFAF